MRIPSHPWKLVALILTAAACGPGMAPDANTPEDVLEEGAGPGRLVIIGGALQQENTPVYQAVLDGMLGEGPLCVIPTASADPNDSMDGYVSDFNALGGEGVAEGILLSVDNGYAANDSVVVARMRACGGFFFTGGSQSRIMDVFKAEGESTGALQALSERFQAGAVVSGSSAGAAIMTDPMIAGGGSLDALESGLRAGSEGEGVWLREGMGFLHHGLVDQHFLARGRWARLMVAVLDSETDSLGFGIDENTALVVEGDTARVIGESGVVFMDARGAGLEPRGSGGYAVRLFLLGEGDRVYLATGEVLPDPSKLPLAGGTELSENSDVDLFARWTLLHLLADLGSAADPSVAFSQAGHSVELRKAPGFQALAWEGLGVQDTPRGLSLGPFVLNVWRE